jgi:hypothetical protein
MSPRWEAILGRGDDPAERCAAAAEVRLTFAASGAHHSPSGAHSSERPFNSEAWMSAEPGYRGPASLRVGGGRGATAARVLGVVRGRAHGRRPRRPHPPGWKLYENALGATGAFTEQELAPVEWRQIVRLNAASSDEARRLIIDVLGREPDDLRTDPRIRLTAARRGCRPGCGALRRPRAPAGCRRGRAGSDEAGESASPATILESPRDRTPPQVLDDGARRRRGGDDRRRPPAAGATWTRPPMPVPAVARRPSSRPPPRLQAST